jgi:hypothetical protein
MPSFVPRSLQPYQKTELLEKRISELRTVVSAGASAEKTSRAAEKVRAAVLAVMKARRSILAGTTAAQTLPPDHPDAAKVTRQIENLRETEERWLALTANDIVSQLISEQGVD